MYVLMLFVYCNSSMHILTLFQFNVYDTRGHQFIYDVTFARMGHYILIKKYIQGFFFVFFFLFYWGFGVVFLGFFLLFFCLLLLFLLLLLLDLYTCML